MDTASRTMGVREEELYGFILEQIDSVPHLEALLLLWDSRPRMWRESELAERLFVTPEGVRSILADLVRRGLALERPEGAAYSYLPSQPNDRLVDAVVRAYRADLIRITTAIHSKASSGIREFARAFQFGRKGKKP